MKIFAPLRSSRTFPLMIVRNRRSRMPELMLTEPVELTEAELDLVTGGSVVSGGLVNVTLSDTNVQVLNDLHLLNGLTIKDVANNNQLSVGAIIQLLGGGAAMIQRQA